MSNRVYPSMDDVNEAVKVRVGQYLYFAKVGDLGRHSDSVASRKSNAYFEGMVTDIYPTYFIIEVFGRMGTYKTCINKADIFNKTYVMSDTPFKESDRADLKTAVLV